MRMLIADDDAVLRTMLAAQVRAEGFDVEVVADGLEALSALTGADAPPIALVDWMMPGLDGPTVCGRVRAMAGIWQPYLITMSVKTLASDMEHALNSGANEYICKPFTIRELRSKLRAGRQIMELRQRLADVEGRGESGGLAQALLAHFKRCPRCGLVHGRPEGLSDAERNALHNLVTEPGECDCCGRA